MTTATPRPSKSEKQKLAERLAMEAGEGVRLAKQIMESMMRQRRTSEPQQPQIVYEQQNA